MYIPEFWCGVIATILFEIGSIIVLSVYFNLKGGEKNETTKEID